MASGADVWSGFSADPRRADTAGLKASDADRDHATDVLREAFADGRLTRDEYETRTASVLATRTLGGFVEVLGDLVAQAPADLVPSISRDLRAKAAEKYRRDLRDARNGWIFVTTLCVVIWGATSLGANGPYFFWPIFPSIGVGIGYFAMRLNAEQRIEAIEDKIAETRRTRRQRDAGTD